jgi:hypothetical protein
MYRWATFKDAKMRFIVVKKTSPGLFLKTGFPTASTETHDTSNMNQPQQLLPNVPPGYGVADLHKKAWPSDWRPNYRILEPNADEPLNTLVDKFIQPHEILEIKLESLEYQITISKDAFRYCCIKYGDDDSCWDYSEASRNESNPRQIHGNLRVRFSPCYIKYGTDQSTDIRFIVSEKAGQGLFLTTGGF